MIKIIAVSVSRSLMTVSDTKGRTEALRMNRLLRRTTCCCLCPRCTTHDVGRTLEGCQGQIVYFPGAQTVGTWIEERQQTIKWNFSVLPHEKERFSLNGEKKYYQSWNNTERISTKISMPRLRKGKNLYAAGTISLKTSKPQVNILSSVLVILVPL